MERIKSIGVMILFIGLLVAYSYNARNQDIKIIDDEAEFYKRIVDCLSEQVPEIENWEEYLWQKSGGENCLFIEYSLEIFDVYRDGEGSEYLGKYYRVYVEEKIGDHRIPWADFYVSVDYDEVLWIDLWRLKWSEHEVYTLDEWRACPEYPHITEKK